MEMKQSNDHILREYYISKVCAVCFTCMYCIACSIVFKADYNIVSDDILVVASLLFFLLPLVLLVSWQMCVERYIYLNLIHCEENDRESKHQQLKSYVRNIILAGIFWGICVLANIYFVVNYWKYIEEIFLYYMIVLVISVVWLFILCMCVKKRERMEPQNKWAKLKVVLIRIFITVLSIVCLTYAMMEASSFAFLKKVS